MTISKQFLSKMAFATLIISTLLGALALRAGEHQENAQQESPSFWGRFSIQVATSFEIEQKLEKARQSEVVDNAEIAALAEELKKSDVRAIELYADVIRERESRSLLAQGPLADELGQMSPLYLRQLKDWYWFLHKQSEFIDWSDQVVVQEQELLKKVPVQIELAEAWKKMWREDLIEIRVDGVIWQAVLAVAQRMDTQQALEKAKNAKTSDTELEKLIEENKKAHTLVLQREAEYNQVKKIKREFLSSLAQGEQGAEQEQYMSEGTVVDLHGFGALAQKIAELKKEIELTKDYFDKHETMIVNDNLLGIAQTVAGATGLAAAIGYGHYGVNGAVNGATIAYTVTGLLHGINLAINAEKLRPNNAKKYYRAAALLAGPVAAVVAVDTLRHMGHVIVSGAGLAKKWAMDWLTKNCSSK